MKHFIIYNFYSINVSENNKGIYSQKCNIKKITLRNF